MRNHYHVLVFKHPNPSLQTSALPLLEKAEHQRQTSCAERHKLCYWKQGQAVKSSPGIKCPLLKHGRMDFCTNITLCSAARSNKRSNKMDSLVQRSDSPSGCPSTLRLQHLTASALLDPGFPAPLTQIANSHQLQKGRTWSAAIGYNYCGFCFYIVQRPFFRWRAGNKGPYYIVKYQSQAGIKWITKSQAQFK